MMDFDAIKEWIQSATLIVGSFIVGLIFKKIILGRFQKIAARTKWEGDEIIINALRKKIILWFVILGFYLASPSIPMDENLLFSFQKLLIVLVILSVTFAVAEIAVGFVKLYTGKAKGVLPPTTIFATITRLLVLVIGILVILQTLGISISPLLAALGVGGLAVALALQDTLANLFAGIHILVTSQIRPGDYVKLETGEEGYVTDITWRNTRIRELPNNIIIVPNSRLASSVIKNYYLPERQMAVLVDVGVAYDSDLEKVEKVTIEVAKQVMRDVDGGIPEFEPFIRYHTFGDFSINFTVILRAREFVNQYLIKHEFIKRLHKRYKEEGIEIPFPIRTVYMKDVKTST